MAQPKTTYTKNPTAESCHHLEYNLFLEIEKRKIFIGLPVFQKPLFPARTLHMLTYINYPIAHTLFKELHIELITAILLQERDK